MAPTFPPPIYSQNKQIPNFSRLLVSETPVTPLAAIPQLRILPSPPSFPRRTQSKFSTSKDLEGLDFCCRGTETNPMPKAVLAKGGIDHHQFTHINASTSSSTMPVSPLSFKNSAVSLNSFPAPPNLSSKTSALSLDSTIRLPPPLISSPKSSTTLSSSLTVSAFQFPMYPPTSSSSSAPSTQSLSITIPFSQSFKPRWRTNSNSEQGFRVVGIAPEQHQIAIELGTLQYILPANHLMWHPVGHVLLLKTVIYVGVLNRRKYFGLLKHMFLTSAGGIHRFRLEDLGNEQWRVKGGNDVCLQHADGPIESINRTWEVRALLAWEKNVFISLWIIIYNTMKSLFVLFICSVHSKSSA